LSIARRPLIDLPLAAVTTSPAMTSSVPGPSASSGMPAETPVPVSQETGTALPDPDFDLSSTFDVPAFLRRQEG
jgi:hypothetical protein